jgi:hypothetical protein
MLVPLGLFYAALWVLGPTGAICAALAWNYMALARRIWCRERLPGVLLIATLGLTARSVVALASGNSLFVYFLQPSLATALLGGAFLLSVPLGRPLAEKLAHDFVPLATYLAAKTGLSAFLTLAGIVVSSWWFRRGIRHQDPVAGPVPVPVPAI